jgi:integrase
LDLLSVIRAKFQKSRLVPIHSSTSQALQDYLILRDACYPGAKTEKLFISKKGVALNYRQVLYAFMNLRLHLGWAKTGQRSPRIHDLRHTFAVNRLLKWVSEGENMDRKIYALSVYLGHAQVTDTYWYLSAVPALLAVVSERFENFAGRDSI